MGVIVNNNGALKNTTESSFYETVGVKWVGIKSGKNDPVTLDWVPKLVMIVVSHSDYTAFAVLTDTYTSTAVPTRTTTSGIVTTEISINGTTLDLGSYNYNGFATCFYFK